MEKRMILALVLCVLVFIIWSFLFSPRKDQTVKKEQVPREINQDHKSPIPAPQVRQEMPKKITPTVQETQIRVETPLYVAVFSNMGPTIRSFELKKYTQDIRPDSPRIELVSLPKEMGNFFVLAFQDASSTRAEDIIYQFDRETIRLEPESASEALVFTANTVNGMLLRQVFHFYPDQYRIDVDMEVINHTSEMIRGNFSASLQAQAPLKKKGYYSFVGLALLVNNELEQLKIKKVSDENDLDGLIEWVAYEDAYFISAIIPEDKSQGQFKGRLSESGILEGTYHQSLTEIEPEHMASVRYDLYFGPRDLSILKQLKNNLDRAVYFGWTDWIAKPLLYILRFFNDYLKNYGLSIILLTILVRVLFWPLTHKSYKSMKEMQKLQPIMAKIKEKYKNDRQKMNTEMMALYKTYKVNPMSGCLPMLIQLPVFFALFRVLGSAIELRHAPFMLWIKDLSAPDRLFHFPFHIPLMAPPYGIPVLTLLMGASMFIQQKMTPTPGDPSQAKVMMLMPIIFTFVFINFPSGLVLYWFISNILTIGQQYRILKKSA